MAITNIHISQEFKKETKKAILTIVVFTLSYLVILGLSILLCYLCIIGGVAFVASFRGLIGILIGLGIISVGLFVFFFVVKFIFSSNTVDRSHMTEIKPNEHPILFQLIEEIVNEVGTKRPKRVYVTAEVNAYVFYDSNFLSMIFPVRKNLNIGLGLVNTVTKDELKAILAHEFGHFSQGTMKVGSYVYYVNKVIYDLLFNNTSFNDMIEKWSNISNYFSFFTGMAIKLIQGIQWLLIQLYEIVNKSHSALSREMEFHADEIAANFAGSEPIKTSLLRMEMSDYSFNATLNFYNEKFTENIKSENIFLDHLTVLHHFAKINNIPYSNNLPNIGIEDSKRFDKSKLVIKDQWASHPSNEDRIARVEKIDKKPHQIDNDSANNYFSNVLELQKKVTTVLFLNVEYKGDITSYNNKEFETAYQDYYKKYNFNNLYNGYYNDKNFSYFDIEESKTNDVNTNFDALFHDKEVEKVYTVSALQNDIEILLRIDKKDISIKNFEYDGKKYSREDAKQLADALENDLKKMREEVKNNDIKIFNYFRQLESKIGSGSKIEKMYFDFFKTEKHLEEQSNNLLKLQHKLQFLNEVTPHNSIISKLNDAKGLESIIKQAISEMLEDQSLNDVITEEMRENLSEYSSNNYKYFFEGEYQQEFLDILYKAYSNFQQLIPIKYFIMKKEILDHQISIYELSCQ